MNEHQACTLFKKKFSAPGGVYARSLRLSRAQIKAWFSTEKGRRLRAGAAVAGQAAVDEADGQAAAPSAAPTAAPTAAPSAAPAAAPTVAPSATPTDAIPSAAPTAATPAPAPTHVDDAASDGEESMVEDIIGVRRRAGKREFLIMWKQTDGEVEDSWEVSAPLHCFWWCTS